VDIRAALGAIGMSTLVVRPGDTTVAQGVNDLPLLANTTLVSLIESSCTAALTEYLGQGETSVTSDIHLALSSTVVIGSEIRSVATCIDALGSTLVFNVEVHHGTKLLASAIVDRRIVDRISYMARSAAESIAEHPIAN
jgi:fluoroacetyl-CoA thioesterase